MVSDTSQKYLCCEMVRTLNVDLALKVRIVEDLNRDFVLAGVQLLQLGVMDSDVLLNVFAGQDNLFVLARTKVAHDGPIGNGDGDAEEENHEEVGLEATILDDGNERLDNVRHDEDEGGQLIVGEGPIALGEADEGRVLNRREIGRLHGGGRHRGSGWKGTLVRIIECLFTNHAFGSVWQFRPLGVISSQVCQQIH